MMMYPWECSLFNKWWKCEKNWLHFSSNCAVSIQNWLTVNMNIQMGYWIMKELELFNLTIHILFILQNIFLQVQKNARKELGWDHQPPKKQITRWALYYLLADTFRPNHGHLRCKVSFRTESSKSLAWSFRIQC